MPSLPRDTPERILSPWDARIKARANFYADLLEVALQRYNDEGRASVDPMIWVGADAPTPQTIEQELKLQKHTHNKDDVYWDEDGGFLEGKRREVIVRSIYHYLKQAQAHGLDLMEMFKCECPDWLKEAYSSGGDKYAAWVAPENTRNRFEKIEGWRGRRLYSQWAEELKQLPAAAECLEIGCGSGFFTREVMKQQPSLHWKATDLPRDLPTNGTELDRNQQSWFTSCAAGKALPYGDASQDVLCVNNVLHHVEPSLLEGFLKEANRVLKPGGKIFITEEFAPRIRSSRDKEGEISYRDRLKRARDEGEITEELYNRQIWNISRQSDEFFQMPKHFSELVDSVFWPEDLGHQRTPENWQAIVKTAGFKSRRKARIVGTFGTPGLPVMEACMVFQKKNNVSLSGAG